MKRRIAALTLVALVSALIMTLTSTTADAATTTPAPYPPSACGVFSVSTTIANPGESITVSGSGFTPGAKLKIIFSAPKKTLASLTITAAGTFTTLVTIPHYPGGSYTLAAVTEGLTCPVDPIRIVIPGGSSSSSGGHTPASTGVDVELLALVAGVLLIAGLGLAGAGRRRNRHIGRHSI